MAKPKKSSIKKKISSRSLNKKFIAVCITLVIAGIGGYLVLSSQAATKVVTNVPAAPAVYVSPTSQTLGINETFTVLVRENSGTSAVNAVQTNFTYPVNLLEYVPTVAEIDASANPNGISFVGTAFGTAAEAKVNTTTGAVIITRGTSGGATLTGDQLIAKLTFKSKTTGGAANITFGTGTALVSSATNTNLLTGTSNYGNGLYTIDTTGPVVSISAPANLAAIEYGSTQNITATATDVASSVTKVEFYIDNLLVATDTTSPFSHSWNTAGTAEASHTISSKAYDTYNNVTTSSINTVTVKDTIAPSVSITAPLANTTVSAATTISATATDNTGGKGISKVEFYVDNILKGTDTTSPFDYTWDTKTATDAAHSITAKAYDGSTTANIKTSTAVAVTVDNTDRTAPTTPTSLRTTGNTFTSISIAWNVSTDNVGVTGYRLSRNGTVVYTGTALTHNDTGLSVGTSYSYSLVAFDAAGNASTATLLTASSLAQKIGDINGDNLVDIYDLSTLLSKWNTTDAACDLNKDGTVNVFDLSILLTKWGS